MDKNILNEISEKLDIILSLFSIKDNGKEKTLLEKYNETKQISKNEELLDNYKRNSSRAGYLGDLKDILEDSFTRTGCPPNTDKEGFFEVDGYVYNIKDNV
ncbi:MAG: hypothetical protein ACFFAU_01040 [Candidatus Hodarchaeota archaeon]